MKETLSMYRCLLHTRKIKGLLKLASDNILVVVCQVVNGQSVDSFMFVALFIRALLRVSPKQKMSKFH